MNKEFFHGSFDSQLRQSLCDDRPPQNRIDDQMVDERATALTAIERSDAQVVIVRSEGNDFSFGGDILPWPEASPHELRARFEHYMSVFNRLERTSLPVIAARSGQMCPPRGRREAGFFHAHNRRRPKLIEGRLESIRCAASLTDDPGMG